MTAVPGHEQQPDAGGPLLTVKRIRYFAIIASYLALGCAAFLLLPEFDAASFLRGELLIASFAAAAFFAFSVVLIGIRNGIVLKLTRTELRFTIFGSAISVAFNFFLPFRMGDAARILFLKRHCKVSLISGTSATGIERAVDLSILGFVFLVAAVTGAFSFLEIKYPPGVILLISVLPLFCLACAVLLLRSRMGRKFWLVNFIRENLAHLTDWSFWAASGRKIALLSVAIWLVNFSGIAVFFLICEPNADSFAVAVMVLVGVNLAIAFPLTPGAMGIFQAVCVTILASQDVPFERAFADGVMLHFAIVFLPVLATIPILVRYGIGLSQIRSAVMRRDLLRH
jgi:uncharacterized membrane protein YbhN (UPF0104 family)